MSIDAHALGRAGEAVDVSAPPFDVVADLLAASWPQVAGASVCAQFVYTAGPRGVVDQVLVVEDGVVVEAGPGWCDRADVFVQVDYRRYLAYRLGECTVVEAIEGGQIDGDVLRMSVLAGVLDGETWRAVRAGGRARALAAWQSFEPGGGARTGSSPA